MSKAKKVEKRSDKLEFISTKDFSELSGIYKEFMNNNYGVSIILETENGLKALGLQTVLRGLIKANLDKFIKDVTEITIVKLPKPANKSYYLYELFIDGVKVENQTRFNASDIREFL